VKTKEMFGSRVQQLRKSKGWTQEMLAEKMDISTNYISGIERGIENPTFDMLINLSASLKVGMDEIFDFSHEDTPKQLRRKLISYVNSLTNADLKETTRIIKAIGR